LLSRRALGEGRDRDVDTVVKIDNGVVRPERLLDLLPKYQFALLPHQHAQDPKRLFLQKGAFYPLRVIRRANLPSLDIDLKRA